MRLAAAVLFGILLAGCALRPAGEDEERERSLEAGRPFEEQPVLPALTESSAPGEFVRIALHRNPELQSRYWEWRAAIEQIPQDSSWPNAALSYEFMFRPRDMSSWNRTTLSAGNDPMSNIPFPTKLSTAGRIALENARAAGHRFEETKLRLQGRVLGTYHDFALLAESIRLQQARIAIAHRELGLTETLAQTGRAHHHDLLNARTRHDLAQSALLDLTGRVPVLTARMNALLDRPATDPLPLPAELPPARPVPFADSEILGVAAQRSPGLAALARQVAGREEALSLAQQAYLPDFGLSFSVTGNVTRMAEAMLTLPLRLEAISAGIEQARADLKAVEAAKAQYARNLEASFVLNLYVLRNDERKIGLFEKSILQRLQHARETALASYATGHFPYSDLLDAERAILDVRLIIAELRTEREKALAAIETWTGDEVEMSEGGKVGKTKDGGAGMKGMER